MDIDISIGHILYLLSEPITAQEDKELRAELEVLLALKATLSSTD
jgi:hypothetical protein